MFSGPEQKALNEKLVTAVKDGKIDQVKALCSLGADFIRAKCPGLATPACSCDDWQFGSRQGAGIKRKTETALCTLAAEFKAAAVADLLISRGAEIDAINHAGDQPLHKAVFKGHDGADLEAFESKGGTAIHIAAEQGTTAAAELLLARGARIDAINRSSNQPLNVAVAFGHFLPSYKLWSRRELTSKREEPVDGVQYIKQLATTDPRY
ncbi:hypothetical protein CERZMDRAFT_98641 [Cercospora zeae-maydis SCOH1-5]|uniref:protein S-acyltransferase n=1 Tax=Cercospora zeae-maydis SCOH1-5 TaxID=717836 RepID=A0A6A6FD75_9PEZI|nr:hypothetical protein CERZMDRAFT_98641 [Cercospora zeae-maydis SCOH1-5]